MNTALAVIDALRRAPDIILPLVREVPPGVLKRRPAPRRWSAHEHACHLAHVHALFFDRLEYMLADPAPVIRPYLPGDQDADDLLLRMDLDACLDRFVLDRERLVARLETLSPLNVLARGYSLTRSETDLVVVRDPAQVVPGDRLVTHVQHGRIVSRVEQTLPADLAVS